jgi:flagellar basal-body rod protein FlgB
MFFTGSFAKNLDLLQRGMDVAGLRNRVLANNIANSDVPNFKRSEVTFEAQLKRALDSEKIKAPVQPPGDQWKPFAYYKPLDYRTVEPNVLLDYLTTAKNNGNNVDIEVEMMNLLENQLMYQTMAQVIASDFARVNLVLR